MDTLGVRGLQCLWWTLLAWEGYSVSGGHSGRERVTVSNGSPGTDGHSGCERVTVPLMDTLGVRGLQCLWWTLLAWEGYSVSGGCERVTVSLMDTLGVRGLQCLWWTLLAWEGYSVSGGCERVTVSLMDTLGVRGLQCLWWTLLAWEGYSVSGGCERVTVSLMDTLGVRGLQCLWWTLLAWEGYSVSGGHSGRERVTVSLMDTLGVRGLQCLWWTLLAWEGYSVSDGCERVTVSLMGVRGLPCLWSIAPLVLITVSTARFLSQWPARWMCCSITDMVPPRAGICAITIATIKRRDESSVRRPLMTRPPFPAAWSIRLPAPRCTSFSTMAVHPLLTVADQYHSPLKDTTPLPCNQSYKPPVSIDKQQHSSLLGKERNFHLTLTTMLDRHW